MIETLKTVIRDFQESDPETGVPRRLNVRTLRGKATVCVGVRRSGKSTYLYQAIRRLRKGGVPRENILYLNFFDDRLRDLRRAGIDRVVEAYYALYPEKKDAETVYCFFDEIQDVAGWESFVDRLLRTERCEVWLTGSSAAMLSKEIATQMRGRALSWEIFPFSFREFLDGRGIASEGALSTKQGLTIRKAFEEYWESGGFPEVVGLDRDLRVRIHQEYFHAILLRDVVERHDVAHPKAVADLAYRLADNVAALYSINGLTGYLQSLGHKAPKTAVADYVEWFEDAYFLFTVRLFDASLSRSNVNPKKIYCVDHAMVTSVASGILVNSGRLLENLVFTALRRCRPTIYYYRTTTGREVDFIVSERAPIPRRRPRMLVQVCETLADPETRAREIAALDEAMAETGLKEGTIVTKYDTENIAVGSGTIKAIPVWRFLIDLPESME